MAKQDPTGERAGKLVEALRGQREGGDYPLTVAKLRELAAPESSEEEVFKALAKKPYAAELILAGKKDLASPVALAEDRETLASSPLLLEYALGKVCSPEKP